MNKSDQKTVDLIKKTLKETYNPLRLFIFGSRANGTAKKDSDYDFVMVVHGKHKTSLDDLTKARSLIWDKHEISADIFIYSEKEFADWKDEFNSIPEIAVSTGKEIEL